MSNNLEIPASGDLSQPQAPSPKSPKTSLHRASPRDQAFKHTSLWRILDALSRSSKTICGHEDGYLQFPLLKKRGSGEITELGRLPSIPKIIG